MVFNEILSIFKWKKMGYFMIQILLYQSNGICSVTSFKT